MISENSSADKHLPKIMLPNEAQNDTPSSSPSHQDSMKELISALKEVPKSTGGDSANKVLEGFHKHPKLTKSLLKSSLQMALAKRGSDDVQKALSSRWSKFRVIPIREHLSGIPVGLTIEFFFIQEESQTEDPTEEVHDLLSKFIIVNKYYKFITQLVTNTKIERFTEHRKSSNQN